MSKISRAEFLGLSGVLAGAALGCGRPPGARAERVSAAGRTAPGRMTTEADLVVLNARILTIDGRQPTAEALAVYASKAQTMVNASSRIE